jgi:hypothetical protein
MRRIVLPLLTLVLAARLAAAQEAGHATLPARGAGARGDLTTTAREPDLVADKLEELRKGLADAARAYKKESQAARREKQGELLGALARVEAELRAARGLVDRR